MKAIWMIIIVVVLGTMGCFGGGPAPVFVGDDYVEGCYAPAGQTWRSVELIGGDCSHVVWGRTMAPAEGPGLISDRACGVEVSGSVVSEQVGQTLYGLRILHLEQDQVWEHWIMSLEDQRTGEICVEQYRVDHVPEPVDEELEP